MTYCSGYDPQVLHFGIKLQGPILHPSPLLKSDSGPFIEEGLSRIPSKKKSTHWTFFSVFGDKVQYYIPYLRLSEIPSTGRHAQPVLRCLRGAIVAA